MSNEPRVMVPPSEDMLICPHCSHPEFWSVDDQNGVRWLQCLGCDARSKLGDLVTREKYNNE